MKLLWLLVAVVGAQEEAVEMAPAEKLSVRSRQTPLYAGVTPKLRIEGTGFEGDGKNLHLKFVPSLPEGSYSVSVTSETSLSVLLKDRQRWPLPEGSSSCTLYLSSLKDDLSDDPDAEKVESPIPVAAILGTPSIVRRDDRVVYETGTRRLYVNGTNFRPKETSFVFDPPLFKDIDYVMEVRSESVALLTLKSGRRWRSDGDVGPLKIKRLDTGGGQLRIDAKYGGVTIAVVQADLGAHGVTVETTSDKRLYQSSKTLTILGKGFNDTGVKGANTLRWANSLRGKGVNFTIVHAEQNQLDLELAPGSKWRANAANLPGTLILLAVNAGAGPIPVGATEAKKGRAVATIYADPVITTTADDTTLYSTLSHELWVQGHGFTRSTLLTLRAKYAEGTDDNLVVKYEPLRVFADYVLVAFNETHMRLWLQDGKSWSPSVQDAVLECTALDTGAGPWPEISEEKPWALAKIVEDAKSSSAMTVTRTVTTQTVYQNPATSGDKKLTIEGAKFCDGTKNAAPGDLEFKFSPDVDQKSTFTVKTWTPTKITLDLMTDGDGKKARWPVGSLKLLAMRCNAKNDFATFAGDEGVAVAEVLPNPVIELHPGLILYAHHSKKLVIRGSGFSVDSTEIVLSPTQDPPPYRIAECLEDYIALELLDDESASWVAEDLLPAKDAPQSEGIALTVKSIDTGAGPVAYAETDAPAVAKVVNEPEGDICDDSCEYANDGRCDDGTQPFLLGDDDGATPYGGNRRRFYDSMDDDFGGLAYDDDDDIYGYGDEYGYGDAFDRGYDEYGEGGWMNGWRDDDNGFERGPQRPGLPAAAACAAGTDCSDCQPRGGDGRLNEAPEVECDNSCIFANDGYCDDGRDGRPSYCPPGTDCFDCGPKGASNYTRSDDEFWDDDNANFYFHDDYWDDYDRQYWGDDDAAYYDDALGANATTKTAKKFAGLANLDDDDAAANIKGYVKSQNNPFEIDPSVAAGNDDSLASLLLAGAFVAVLALAACGALRLRVGKGNAKRSGCLPLLGKSKDESKDLATSWKEMTARRDNNEKSASDVPITPDVTYSGANGN